MRERQRGVSGGVAERGETRVAYKGCRGEVRVERACEIGLEAGGVVCVCGVSERVEGGEWQATKRFR